jgi:phosphoribosylanthranilate isomerase
MVKVKICGITNMEDALASLRAGCDALGFLFYKNSPRSISPFAACRVIKQLPPQIIKIGVFVNAKEKTIKRIARSCKLDMLQFHGDETPEFCARFKEYKIIKVFRIKKTIDLKKILKYRVFACLLDTFDKSKRGGTGKQFDWSLACRLKDIHTTVFLSGGLTEKNVQKAIRQGRPQWVDASSSLEVSPGKKDHQKVVRFVRAAKRMKI